MSRVITFSRTFPAYHPKKGQPTYFVEKLYNSLYEKEGDWSSALGDVTSYVVDVDTQVKELKHHTIRAGSRWKVGDKFSPRVWSDKPYNSKMITIAPDIEIKKVWDFETKDSKFYINGKLQVHTHFSEFYDFTGKLACNDGLDGDDLLAWLKFPFCDFKGQIICWNERVEY